MPRFRFQGIDSHGHRVARTVEADTIDVARKQLRDAGFAVNRIKRVVEWWRSPVYLVGIVLLAAGFVAGMISDPMPTILVSMVLASAGLVVAAVAWSRAQAGQQRRDRLAERRQIREQAAHEKQDRDARRRAEGQQIEALIAKFMRELEFKQEAMTRAVFDLDELTENSANMPERHSLEREIAAIRQEVTRIQEQIRELEVDRRSA